MNKNLGIGLIVLAVVVGAYWVCTNLLFVHPGPVPGYSNTDTSNTYQAPAKATLPASNPESPSGPWISISEFNQLNPKHPYAAASFPQLDPSQTTISATGRYAKDGKLVLDLIPGQTIPGADAASFVSLGALGEADAFAKDVNHVYCGSTVIGSADPATFTLIVDTKGIHTGYAHDKANVYTCDGQVVGADPSTFAPFTSQVFDQDQMMDSGSYSMDGGYAKDKSHVYYVRAPGGGLGGSWDFFEAVVAGADPNTFTLPPDNAPSKEFLAAHPDW